MENSTEYVATAEIKRNAAAQLIEIHNNLSALDTIGGTLKSDIEAHFTNLMQVLTARKVALTQQVDSKISAMKNEIEGKKEKATNTVQVCTQIMSFASQMFPLSPHIALATLKTVHSVSAVSGVLPIVKVVFSGDSISNLNREGDLIVGQLTTVAGSEDTGFKDGTGTDVLFSCPQGIAFSPKDGFCYVADCNNNTIRKVSSQGDVSTFAGTGEQAWVDGPSSIAKFNNPVSVAVNHTTGDVYVSDYRNHKIRKITPGGIVTTVAGSGAQGCADGLALSASFSNPWGIDINQSDGCVYVADYGNSKIRKITPQGEVSTVGGTTHGFSDGPVDTAKFNYPMGVAVHPSTGVIYVADRSNRRIRKISSGFVSTVAGSGIAGDADGEGAIATFANPLDVKIDATDDSLLVAEYNSGKIRKITTQGVVSTVAWPTETGVNSVLTYPMSISIDQQNRLCYISVTHKLVRLFLP